jgi:hypothetical protein
MPRCGSCRADWQAGEFSEGCEECGGGALAKDCVVCGGICGNRWTKALMDTQDEGMAHWLGNCGLPREAQGVYQHKWQEEHTKQRTGVDQGEKGLSQESPSPAPSFLQRLFARLR